MGDALGISWVTVRKGRKKVRSFCCVHVFPANEATMGWTRGDSNPWPPPCEGGALPTELRAPGASAILAAGDRIARQGAKGMVTPSVAVTVPQPTIVYADVQGSSGTLAPESQYRNWLPLLILVPK